MRRAIAAIPFLVLLAAARGEIAPSPWPDPAANDVVPYRFGGLTHGPMLGRPTATSMRVWVRTVQPMKFTVVYDTELPLTAKTAGVAGKTTAEADNTGFVDITRLRPDTRYFYGVVTRAGLVDTRMHHRPGFPSFRTLPDERSFRDGRYNPKGRFNFSFGVGFGNRQGRERYDNAPTYSTLFERHAGALRFFLMNGDYIYEAQRTPQNRPHGVELFRADYKTYLERGRDMARFLRYVPMLFTYDDHETFSDLEGTGEIGLREGKWLYRDLALGPWQEYAGWANFRGPRYQPIRRGTAAVEKGGDVLHDPAADFSTLRPGAISTIHVQMGSRNAGVYGFVGVLDRHRLRVRPAFAHQEKCAYSVGTHHWFDFKVGNCHFFVLDTRGERTRYLPAKAHDPDRFMLGEAQAKWLMDGAAGTDADFIFVVSSVSWVIYHTNFHVVKRPPKGRSAKEDGFCGFVAERERLLKALDALEKPVIVLTGDLHNAFAIQITDNVWEFMTGPLSSANHPIATAGDPPYGGWFNSEGRRVKIKWVSGFPNEVSYRRLRNVYYGVVQVNNVLKSGRQASPGLHWVAYDEPQVVVRIHDGYTGQLVYAEGISTADARRPPPAPAEPERRRSNGR